MKRKVVLAVFLLVTLTTGIAAVAAGVDAPPLEAPPAPPFENPPANAPPFETPPVIAPPQGS